MTVVLYRDGLEVCRDGSEDQDVVGDILWDMLQHTIGLSWEETLVAIQAGQTPDGAWTWEVKDARMG